MKRFTHLTRLIGMMALVWLALELGSVRNAVRAQSGAPEVVVLEATGPVVPPFAAYIARGIEKADELNAEAVILVLNTPGGNVSTTLEIVQDIRNSDVPVIVWVGPRGAKAASAGLLITLAGHASAMAPETAIGASSPISSEGEDLNDTAQQKAEEYLSAQVRGLAERRGEAAVTLATEAVTEARAASSNEALEAGLIDFVVEDVDELLTRLDGFEVEVNGVSRTLHTGNATQVPLSMNAFERTLLVVTDPNIVMILLSLGTTLIIIEAWTPGGWAAGTTGVTCLGLALYGLGVLPVNWLGMVFIVLAFVLFLLDIKAPTHGALTAAAIISLAAGAIILFNRPEIAPFGKLSIPLVVGQSLLLGGVFAFLVYMAVRAQARRPTTGHEGLVGQIGRVTQDLAPEGIVLIWGERWHAEAEGDQQTIPAGSRVEVVEVHGLHLLVRPAAKV